MYSAITSRQNVNTVALVSALMFFIGSEIGIAARTITVWSTANDGEGSLRQAIIASNTNQGPDRIEFDFPGTDPVVIRPSTPLPPLTDPVVLDGTTRTGYSGVPLIQIDGSDTTGDGLQIVSGNCQIRGLSITHWKGNGIRLNGPRGNNLIAGNYLGITPSGAAAGNGATAVTIYRSSANHVGGLDLSDRNIISGSNSIGIYIVDAASKENRVCGNYIGVTADGTKSLGNINYGIYILGAPNNVIGGTEPGARNIISGNGQSGIMIANRTVSTAPSTATNNLILGNFIGTDPSGQRAIGNAAYGVQVSGASANLIGGPGTEFRNIISGNKQYGIAVSQLSSEANRIRGNFIGLAADGATAVPNLLGGIALESPSNFIGGSAPTEGNVIAGNGAHGIYLAQSSTNSIIQGNLIGTTASGKIAVGNAKTGLQIESAANQIGGVGTGAGNVVGGNKNSGIYIYGLAASNNLVQGNYIGVSSSFASISNAWHGINISNAPGTMIGGSTPEARNVICANGSNGILIGGTNSRGNLVQGNYIGTSPDGRQALGNLNVGLAIQGASLNVVGGATPGAGNVISANGVYGIYVTDAGAYSNIFQGNLVGLSPNGISALGTGGSGMMFINSAHDNLIGGSSVTADNKVAYNGAYEGGFDGIRIMSGCIGNFISRNNVFSNDRWHVATSLGIDYGSDGVTLAGVPVLSSALSGGGQTVITGSLKASANQPWLIQFYANTATNTAGYGEGQYYIGQQTVTTDNSGTATFSTGLATNLPLGLFVAATATDPSWTTYEYSRAIPVAASASPASSQIISQKPSRNLDYLGVIPIPAPKTTMVASRQKETAPTSPSYATEPVQLTTASEPFQYSGPALIPIVTNGPAANRLNIVFLSEGYTSSEMDQFVTDATSAAEAMLSTQPYAEYRDFYNVYAIAVASAQSGSSHPQWPLSRDTYFNSSYDSELDYILSIPPNDLDSNYTHGRGKVDALLQEFLPYSTMPILLVNELVAGGSGGNLCVAALGEPFPELLVHEAGHTLAKLGDEYTATRDYASSLTEDTEPNTTRETRRDSVKWKAWISDDTPVPTPPSFQYASRVGLFEGAHYSSTGWYRPKMNCIMRQMDAGAPFCEVCTEAHVKATYEQVSPIDSYSPASSLVVVSNSTPAEFSLALLQPKSMSIQVQWYLNGNAIPGATNPTYAVSRDQLSEAVCRLEAQVRDQTALVRQDPSNLLARTVSWTVAPDGVPVSPLIVGHPQNQRVHAGDTAQLSVTVHGSEPLTYRWRFQDTDIPGANSSTLAIPGVGPDDAGNYSVRVTNAFGAVTSSTSILTVSLPFQIVLNGPGAVAPNYNGQWLDVGASYTATATPGSKCKFAGWSGAATGSTPKVVFTVQTNSVLTANFTDPVNPSVSIVSPTEGARVTNAAITFKGKSADNGPVSNVQVRLNGGAWTDALTSNHWTNWTAQVGPAAGPNLVEVVSIDSVGNRSATVSRHVTYVVNLPLTVETNGSGSVTPNLNGKNLEVGKTYQLTAVPGKNQLFAGWSNGSKSPKLSFQMISNLVLQANFVTNPFIALKGSYSGLYQSGDHRSLDSAGYVKLTLTDQGAFSGTLLGPAACPISGKFWVDGTASVTTRSKIPVTLNLALDLSNTNGQITGEVTGQAGVSPLLCDRAVRSPIAPGTYTVDIATTDNEEIFGDGYGTAKITSNGTISFTGMLGDGTTISQAGALSADGRWPMHASVYGNKGWIQSWITFTNADQFSLSGEGAWLKEATSKGRYPKGFTNNVLIIGSTYQVPARGSRIVEITSGEVVLTGGGLLEPITNSVVLETNNILQVVSGTNALKLTVSTSKGTVSGTFKHPVTGASTAIRGVVLQKEAAMRGYFLGTTNAGIFEMTPQ